MNRVKPGTIQQTKLLHPAQWQGRTPSGEYIYAQSMEGYTSVSVGTTLQKAKAGVSAHHIWDIQAIDSAQLIALIKEERGWNLVSEAYAVSRTGIAKIAMRKAS